MIVALVGTKKNIVYEVGKCVQIGSKTLVVKNIQRRGYWNTNGRQDGECYVVDFADSLTLQLPDGDYGILYKNDEKVKKVE